MKTPYLCPPPYGTPDHLRFVEERSRNEQRERAAEARQESRDRFNRFMNDCDANRDRMFPPRPYGAGHLGMDNNTGNPSLSGAGSLLLAGIVLFVMLAGSCNNTFFGKSESARNIDAARAALNK